jgi:hypothetical protein
MSATNRGKEKVPQEFYETQRWVVNRLLDAVRLPGTRWLEPASGSGAIIRAVDTWRRHHNQTQIIWTSSDLRETKLDVADNCIVEHHTNLDYTFMNCPEFFGRRWDVVITNPPFSLAFEFVKQALEHAPVVVLLLRINWLGSQDRRDWLKAHRPAVHVLPNRPDFTGEGGDATEYAWLIWGLGWPEVDILELTAPAIRTVRTECSRCRELEQGTLAWSMCSCHEKQAPVEEVLDSQLPLVIT